MAAPTAALVAAEVAANPALRVAAVVAVHQTVAASSNRAVEMAAWVPAVVDGNLVDLVSVADPDAVAVQPSGDLAVLVVGFAEAGAADRNLKRSASIDARENTQPLRCAVVAQPPHSADISLLDAHSPTITNSVDASRLRDRDRDLGGRDCCGHRRRRTNACVPSSHAWPRGACEG